METPFDTEDTPENVFRTVEVHVDASLDTIISWRLKDSVPPTPGLFRVEVSHFGEPFTAVSENLDDCQFRMRDTHVVSPDDYVTSWRVVYMANGREYPSCPVTGHVLLSKGDIGLLNTIAHREAMTIERYSGMKGKLLKVRTSGAICPICVDRGISASARSSCPNCFGTGYAGGYYNGRPWTLAVKGVASVSKQTNDAIGTVEPDNSIIARAMASEPAEEGDVWVDDITGDRWLIHDYKPEISFKNVTVTCALVMSRLQKSIAHPLNDAKVSEQLLSDRRNLWETL